MKEERIRTHLISDDALGGSATLVAEFISTLPHVIPFLFIRDWQIALCLANFLMVLNPSPSQLSTAKGILLIRLLSGRISSCALGHKVVFGRY